MTTPTPPGWYDDPEDPNAQRYWDGQSWTPNRQPKPTSPPIPQPVTPPPPPPSALPPAPPGQQPQWSPPYAGKPRSSLTPVLIIVGVVVAVVAGGLVAAFLIFWNEKTIVPEKAAETLANAVSQQTGFRPTDTKCPSGIDAKVGMTFDCHFTGPDGPYTAHMKVTKVDGDYVEFDMVWSLSNK